MTEAYWVWESELLVDSGGAIMSIAMTGDLSSNTLRALRRILRATDIASRNLAATTGLTPSQWLVLREIQQLGQATPGTLAQALQFSQATITAIIDRLAAQELVERERSVIDKRQFHLRLLPAGDAILADAPDPLQASFTARYAQLSTWEQAMILAATERLAHLMDAADIDAAPLLDSGQIDRTGPV